MLLTSAADLRHQEVEQGKRKKSQMSLDSLMISTTSKGPRCQICGKPLTDPKSIQKNIGPTCAKKNGLLKSLYHKGITARTAAQKLDVPFEKLPILLAELNGIPCQYCDNTYTNKQELSLHCNESHNRPYSCPERTCNYAFKWKNNLRSHFQRKHSERKNHLCPFDDCEYVTTNSGDLQSHIRHVHSKNKPHECPNGCGYAAKSRSKILRHLRREACWYQSSMPKLWEVLCYRIANILFKGKKWDWKPQIRLPQETLSQSVIEPEIAIFGKNESIEKIIDAKTSIFALRKKDVKIYPLIAEKNRIFATF